MLALRKFNSGIALNDTELKDLLIFYTALEGLLTVLGDQFYLPKAEVRRRLEVLRGFKHARETM